MRMARIVNHTWSDPRTLNVNIDSFKYRYKETIQSILHHIGLSGRSSELANELSFFDYTSSPLYRWSVSNPLFSHVDTRKRGASNVPELLQALRRDRTTMEMYAPILELMHAAFAGQKMPGS